MRVIRLFQTASMMKIYPFKFDVSGFFDYRDIYIMKRITRRSWYARFTFQSEYKIGIAKNTVRRNKTINKAVRGRVVIMSRRPVLFAYNKEQRLHRLFADTRFTMKGGKGGGLTEWFYLSFPEYLILECWLFWYSIRPYFWGGFFILIFLLKTQL